MNTIQETEYDKLIKELEEESSQVIPMLRSKVYPEVVAKGESIIPSLVSSVHDATVKHYLTLMAIGEIDPKALARVPVDNRLKIYLDALQKGGPHNDWGLAGEYFSGASLDLISIGEKAVPYLMPLLDVTTPAGIWGSEEATINKLYQNRVCDFAYYLILRIINRNEAYSQNLKKRDVAIASLKQLLKSTFQQSE